VHRFDIDATLVDADVTRGRELIATITPDLTLDRRDRPLDPRRGSFHLASVEVGSFGLGGATDFLETRLEAAGHLDQLRPTVLALGARLGLATPLGDTTDLPIEERSFAGGATTVRGYRERRLGPLDAKGNPLGGNALVVLNVEWRFPDLAVARRRPLLRHRRRHRGRLGPGAGRAAVGRGARCVRHHAGRAPAPRRRLSTGPRAAPVPDSAGVRDRGIPVLMAWRRDVVGRLSTLAVVTALLAPASAPAAPVLVDRVLAAVGDSLVTASDVALARGWPCSASSRLPRRSLPRRSSE
jgi:Omp85 superfamily domain